MSTGFIDEYLVKLGSTVDQSGMQRFHQALREATVVSESSAAAIGGAFFKAQAEIVGGFTAIGTAAVGLVDKVAMADQSYRLFALHMYMSKDAARSLKAAMDALGEPLENLTWDKELRDRTHQLVMDQRAMAPDGNFDAQMRKVRDIRFEFTRMEVELQYLTMHVVQDFLKALGFGPDELLGKLRRFNDWIIHDLPQISQKMVSLFMPIWHDIEMVGNATWKAFQAAGVAFANIVGLLSGDSSITGTTFDIQKLAGAVDHVVGGFASFAVAISNVAEMLAHLVSAVALLFHLDFAGAGAELGAAFHSLGSEAVGGVAGGVIGGLGGASSGAFLGGLLGSVAGPVGTAVGASVGGVIGASSGAVGGAFVGSNVPGWGSNSYGPSGKTLDHTDTMRLVQRYAEQYGVDARLAGSLVRQESGFRQFAPDGSVLTSSTGAKGVMQLTRATAKGLGVDREDTEQNVKGGMALFAHLLQRYNDAPTAVAAYHEGESKMNAVLAGKATLSDEARVEVARVMAGAGRHGNVQVGSIVVHIDKPNAVNADVANAVAVKLRAVQEKRVQRNLAEFQDVSWGY
jgi:hypothetical protein